MKQKLKQNKFIVVWKCVYNQATGKNDTLPGFRTTANTIDFVNSNSDVPYDSTYIAKDLPAVDADKLFNLPAGAVYGIYLENTTVFLNL
jgi:peptidyl-prolyl cis-trans isomerase D